MRTFVRLSGDEVMPMPNLFPDMEAQQYEGSEDFIIAAPLLRQQWVQLSVGANIIDGVHWCKVLDHWHDRDVVLLLADSGWTIDAMVEIGAKLRMFYDVHQKIYIVPWTDNPAPRVSQLAGVSGQLCAIIDVRGDQQ